MPHAKPVNYSQVEKRKKRPLSELEDSVCLLSQEDSKSICGTKQQKKLDLSTLKFSLKVLIFMKFYKDFINSKNR